MKKIQGKPGFSLSEDFFSIWIKGEAKGFGIISIELGIKRIIYEFFVHPNCRREGVGYALLERALKRGKELGIEMVHVNATEENLETHLFLYGQGFKQVRCFYKMFSFLEELQDIPIKNYGIEVKKFEEGQIGLLAEIQNRIFSGSWGFCPNTPEDIEFYLRQTNSQITDILYFKFEGQSFGYFWSHPINVSDWIDKKKSARIHMLGIEKAFRSQGMGKGMLAERLKYLKEEGVVWVDLTVDSLNHSALNLYQEFGFKPVSKNLWFEKTMK